MRAERPDDVDVVEAAPERPPRAKPGARERRRRAAGCRSRAARTTRVPRGSSELLVRSVVARDDAREDGEALEVRGDPGDEAEERRVGGIGRQSRPSSSSAERAVLVDAESGEICHFLQFPVHLHISVPTMTEGDLSE